jgi:hypothetical protein
MCSACARVAPKDESVVVQADPEITCRKKAGLGVLDEIRSSKALQDSCSWQLLAQTAYSQALVRLILAPVIFLSV